jgi:hypothetical protein
MDLVTINIEVSHQTLCYGDHRDEDEAKELVVSEKKNLKKLYKNITIYHTRIYPL